MARSTEKTTQKDLRGMLDSAIVHVEKGKKCKILAEQAKDMPDVVEQLTESITLHNNAAFALVRKLQSKIVNKLAEDSPSIASLENLLKVVSPLFPTT